MTRMTADQMVSGVLATLARRGYTTLSIRTTQLDAAMEQVFEALTAVAVEEGLDLRFCVSRDLHGDSHTVHNAVAGAVQSGLVGLGGPQYQDIRFTKTASRLDLDSLPGGRALYERLTDVFIARYNNRVPSYR
jgi:hypothetical protein